VAQKIKPDVSLNSESKALSSQQETTKSLQQIPKTKASVVSRTDENRMKTETSEQKESVSSSGVVTSNEVENIEPSALSSAKNSSLELSKKLAKAIEEKKSQSSVSSVVASTEKVKKEAEKVHSMQKVVATSTKMSKSVSKEDMSDEELVKMLLSMEPDQLKKFDVKKLLLEKKRKKPREKVAKTAYLNNQAIVSAQEMKKSEESAKLSQEVEALLGKVEEKKTKHEKEYIEKLQSEIKTREKTMRFYVVKPGDSLSKIARNIYGKGSEYIRIYEANQDIISNPRLIYPGQRLRIPEI
jgi:nucleoid-associated protein YgaU